MVKNITYGLAEFDKYVGGVDWNITLPMDGVQGDTLHEFLQNAGRDMRGIFDAFIKWGTITAQSTAWLDPITAAKQDVAQRALKLDSIASLDGPYKRVSDAARECGIEEQFSIGYKLLSKFAHPTAMRILAPPNEQKEMA